MSIKYSKQMRQRLLSKMKIIYKLTVSRRVFGFVPKKRKRKSARPLSLNQKTQEKEAFIEM